MRKNFLISLVLSLVVAAPLAAQEQRSLVGYGRLVQNDLIGDAKDRWRTGSVSSSRVYAYGWDGLLPEAAGDLIELRLRGEIIAPADLTGTGAGDRPYAGIWALGAHTHFQRGGMEFSLGADLSLLGPETRLLEGQTALHDLLNQPTPSEDVRDGQIEGALRPSALVEVAVPAAFSGDGEMRPFIEAQAGLETYLRAGVDLRFGALSGGDLMIREPVTGQRYRSTSEGADGVSFVLGGDIAQVYDSKLLGSGLDAEDMRSRVRAGLHWQGEKGAVFYGLTWLSPEFEGQPEGQVVGSIRLNLDF